MFKRIAQWLTGIFRTELLAVRGDISSLQAAIVQLRGELAEATAALHSHAEEAKTHAESVASELYESIKNHTESTVDIVKAHTEAVADKTKAHVESTVSGLHESITSHAAGVAADLHAKVAIDAKTIAFLRNAVRMPCVLCGQMSGTYEVMDGKTVCLDCRAKGRTA